MISFCYLRCQVCRSTQYHVQKCNICSCVETIMWLWIKQLLIWETVGLRKPWYIFIYYKHWWNTKWAFAWKLHIFTSENNMLSSHMKRSPSIWSHNTSHLFHWCLYNKQNVTCPLLDMNFIFSCSARYLTLFCWTFSFILFVKFNARAVYV